MEEKLKVLIEVAKYVGYFDEKSAKQTNAMSLYIFEGLLDRVADEKIDKYEAYDDFCDYLEIIVESLKLR